VVFCALKVATLMATIMRRMLRFCPSRIPPNAFT
jgi:hypothetical protein